MFVKVKKKVVCIKDFMKQVRIRLFFLCLLCFESVYIEGLYFISKRSWGVLGRGVSGEKRLTLGWHLLVTLPSSPSNTHTRETVTTELSYLGSRLLSSLIYEIRAC